MGPVLTLPPFLSLSLFLFCLIFISFILSIHHSFFSDDDNDDDDDDNAGFGDGYGEE